MPVNYDCCWSRPCKRVSVMRPKKKKYKGSKAAKHASR